MSIEELSASPQSLDQSRPSENMASPQVDDSQDRPIVTPNENDVLCGRGGSINSHKVRENISHVPVQEGKGKYRKSHASSSHKS